MKITFLGGANEVGASCTLLEVAEKRILVDAGIRMGANEADQLPNLSQIQEGGPLDAILLTHAHTDHIGALPLVHIAYPQIPIFTTAPTQRLTQILLSDALKIMESRWQRENEIPLYPEHTVTAMLSKMRLINPAEPFAVSGPDIIATFTPSGHVMGACSILLDTPDGRVFFTGDYSLDRQKTVEGMLLPRGRPDLVITESTYGNRMHANRKVEEDRLVQSVAEVIQAGGKVLVPAFALGRAQEAILLLLEAQRKKRIPPFPIYVDGMVRSICSAYASFPEYLNRDLRKRIQKIGNPFFPEGACTVEVKTSQQRQAIAESNQPCCIVSSSGMLTGGPSQFYAAALAADPKNAIFITGYQDEESPGRRVLDLVDGKSNTIRLGEREVQVVCKVGRYSLSAHADSAQMLGVLTRLAPKDVYLVHGDSNARFTLAKSVADNMQVHLPKNSESFEHTYNKRGRKSFRVAQPGIGREAVLCFETLRKYLLATTPQTRHYSTSDLARTWYGSAFTEAHLELVRDQLQKGVPGFKPDAKHSYLYQVEHEEDQALSKKERAKIRKGGRLEQNQALQVVSQIFAGHEDLYRKGVNLCQGELLLSFNFPSLAAQRYIDKLEQVAHQTGWKVSLTPGVNQGALITTLQKMLPPTWSLTKTPSIHQDERRVVAKVQCEEATNPNFQSVEAEYQQQTGFRLQIQDIRLGPTNVPAPAKKPLTGDGRLEINTAFGRIRRAFQQKQAQLFRCSRKEDFSSATSWIELSLISPQVAERYQDLRDLLEQETGWPLRFASEPNQEIIKRRTRELIPPEWGLKKEPAFFKNEGIVQVAIALQPPLQAVTELSKQIEVETGYRLHVALK